MDSKVVTKTSTFERNVFQTNFELWKTIFKKDKNISEIPKK